MDPYQKFLARALSDNDPNKMDDPTEPAAAGPGQPAKDEAARPGQQHQQPGTASPQPAYLEQLGKRVTKAIAAAYKSFEAQKKERAAKDLEFIRADLDAACAAAEDLMKSWPSLKIPDSSSVDLNEWPTPAPEFKPNPPGVVHPAPSARVFRGPKTAVTSINSRSVEAPVWILPSHPRVPPYKSWTGVRRNLISIETGQKMFYTEAETGETIPLSDDEFGTLELHDKRVLDGLYREESNAVLLEVFTQLQQEQENEGDATTVTRYKDEDILEAIAGQMNVSVEAAETRLNELLQQQQQQHPAVVNWEEKYDFDSLDKDFQIAFCRLCRKFGCRVHSGNHPRPVIGPMTLIEEKDRHRRLNGRWRSKDSYENIVVAEREPCGSQCYRLFIGAQELEAEDREAEAEEAAAARVEEDEEEDQEEDEEEEEEEDLVADDNDVINLVSSSSEDGTPSKEQSEKDATAAAPAPAAAAAAAHKNGEVSSPVKQRSLNDAAVPKPAILPALDAVINGGGGGGGGASLKKSEAAGQEASKAKVAARAAAAQGAPISAISAGRWSCTACTFINKGSYDKCQMCETENITKKPPLPAAANPKPKQQQTTPPAVPPTFTTDNNKTTAAADEPEAQEAAEQQQGDRAWELWEDAALEKGIEIWGRQPCKIAALVGSRTCTQVRARMMTILPSPAPKTLTRNAHGGAGPSGYHHHNSNINTYDGEHGGNQRRKRKNGKNATKQPSVVYQRLKRSKEEAWTQYHPCGCQGPCKESCPCHGDANFCEKFCGCDPKWCGNRFQGCQCKCGVVPGKRCTTRQCPCLAAGRECDPDLCRLCIPTLNNTNEPGYQCNNFRLRLRQKRRVLMGLSDVQGWGAFLGGPAVKRDDFIGEYCGELIDQLEADHRGKVYDRDDNSYLFDLNQQWVIDARQKGNKLRFANHSTTANCRAEIIMVDGDHRVAILANKDLMPGEEMFYDYRYDKRVAPDWAQGRGRGGDAGGSGASGRGRGRGRGR